MIITTNRYDKLVHQQKKLRNKIQDITTKANNKRDKLQNKINQIKYAKDVKCNDLNNKLKDAVSLTENEVSRIMIEQEIKVDKKER